MDMEQKIKEQIRKQVNSYGVDPVLNSIWRGYTDKIYELLSKRKYDDAVAKLSEIIKLINESKEALGSADGNSE